MTIPMWSRPFGRVYAAAALSLVYVALSRLPRPVAPELRAEAAEASRLMARATSALLTCRAAAGLSVDPVSDPNGTGLIGLETSAVTTSPGRLEAKRTTTNPDFAGLAVMLLREVGARRGDVVAIGASSSFPALIVAVLAAAETMGIEPLVIVSLGSSEWGANDPGFSWPDMEDCLRRSGVLDVRPVALAIGGDEDVGRDMAPEGRALIEAKIRARGVPFLEERDLVRNVGLRMSIYRVGAAGRPIRAFVNIGGSSANIGTDAEVLKLRPGLAGRVDVPPSSERGVLQAMATAGVPVIHLLNVRGLCERYDLPWDPQPLPEPGRGGDYLRSAAPRSNGEVWLTAGFVLAVAALVGARRNRL